jgi:hypothetical protein
MVNCSAFAAGSDLQQGGFCSAMYLSVLALIKASILTRQLRIRLCC